MALYGDLTTISITDLLQWVETARKSGVLTVQRDGAQRRVMFTDGRITACSSDEPHTLLGQALVARGVIDETTLRSALGVQARTGGNLGAILVESGAVASKQIIAAVVAKAEETVYSLFDDAGATFRFDDDGAPPVHGIDTDLRIQDVLLKGVQRYDEMRRIRDVFPHRGVVLARTTRAIPKEIESSRVAGRILRLIDGRRTLAELLLHARASEYLVSKFLLELYRQELVSIVEIRPTAPSVAVPAPALVSAEPAPIDVQDDLATEVSVAQGLLERDEPDAALAVLYATARAHPAVPTVQEMIERAEHAWVRSLYVRVDPRSVPEAGSNLSAVDVGALDPAEAYLLGAVDGQKDVRSLVWISPLREIDVLRALDNLRTKGIVRLSAEG